MDPTVASPSPSPSPSPAPALTPTPAPAKPANAAPRARRSGIGWAHAITAVVAWAILVAMGGYVLGPTLGDRSTVGGHDWDQMESHRFLVMKTILRFHQFPFWNPYSCGNW